MPRRSRTPTPLRRKLALAALVLACLAPGAVRAQTHEDQHVSAIVSRVLVVTSPVALVDPVRQRRARAITDLQAASFAAWALAPIVAFLWLWRSGNAARLRDVLRRRFRSVTLVRACFGAALGLLAWVAMFPFAFAAYRIAWNVGLTRQPIPAWVVDQLGRAGETALATALAVAAVLGLVDRTRLWYLVFAAGLYVATLGVVAVEPVLLAPLSVHQKPAPAAIVALGETVAHRLGVAPVGIVIATDASRSGTTAAHTAGIGPFTRIILDNDALARTTRAERIFILARQYVHVGAGDVLTLALWATTLFVVAAALAVLVSDRIGFRRDDDALARLALVGTCLGLTTLALFPVFNAIERGIERRTDLVAVRATADPAAAVRLFIRSANDNLIPLCGRRTMRWYFDTRPPLGARIAAVTGRRDACRPQ